MLSPLLILFIFLQRFFQSVLNLFPQALGLRHRHIRGEIQGKLLHGHPEHRPDIVAGIHIGVLLHIGCQIRRPAVDPFQVPKGLAGSSRIFSSFDFCSKLNPKAATRLFSVRNPQGFGCTLKNDCSRKIRCRPNAGSGAPFQALHESGL